VSEVDTVTEESFFTSLSKTHWQVWTEMKVTYRFYLLQMLRTMQPARLPVLEELLKGLPLQSSDHIHFNCTVETTSTVS
jgi:hypothetical protein